MVAAFLEQELASERFGAPLRYLAGLPADEVRWEWLTLAAVELLDVRYIRYEYWLELSGGSRRLTACRHENAGPAPAGHHVPTPRIVRSGLIPTASPNSPRRAFDG
jgi:hypothetical protein